MMLSNVASVAFMGVTIGVALYFRKAAEREAAPEA